uniref:Galactose oxidase n=1 Tax=Neobodo designis TaxID=312471 RepID=A0A7S1LPF3_NEODS
MPPKRGGKAAPAAAAQGGPSSTPNAAAAAAAMASSTLGAEGPVLTWTGEIHPSNSAPGRCSAVCMLVDQRILVFGGWGGGATARHVDTIHQLDVGTALWSEVEATGDPHPGTSQAAAVDVGQALLFFGGWDGSKRTNELTLYQTDTQSWAPFATVGERPPALTGHTMTVVGKRVYVYGGNSTEGQSGDVHVLDLTATAWGVAATLGAPPKRSSHSACVVHDTMIVVIGGRGESPSVGAPPPVPANPKDPASVAAAAAAAANAAPAPAPLLNDVAVFDASSSHWAINAKVAESSPVPPARSGHSATAVGSNVVVFGGMGENGQLLNDLWVLQTERITAMTWLKVATDGPPPSIRCSHGAVDSLSCVYIVGGRTDAYGEVSSQVYALNTDALAPLPTMAGDAAGSAHNALADTVGDESRSVEPRKGSSSGHGGPSATPAGTETTVN